MEIEKWDTYQHLVNAGKGHLVVHVYIDEIKSQLTVEELDTLGNLRAIVEKMIADRCDNMRTFVICLVDIAKYKYKHPDAPTIQMK